MHAPVCSRCDSQVNVRVHEGSCLGHGVALSSSSVCQCLNTVQPFDGTREGVRCAPLAQCQHGDSVSSFRPNRASSVRRPERPPGRSPGQPPGRPPGQPPGQPPGRSVLVSVLVDVLTCPPSWCQRSGQPFLHHAFCFPNTVLRMCCSYSLIPGWEHNIMTCLSSGSECCCSHFAEVSLE